MTSSQIHLPSGLNGNGHKKFLSIVIGIMWSALVGLGGFAWGSRSAHLLVEQHIDTGHPVTNTALGYIDRRLTRIEIVLDEVQKDLRNNKP